MTRRAAILVLLALTAAYGWYDDPVGQMSRIRPLEPADAIKSFDVQPGFRIELVASEPLIRSPVALDFDENGRLFVAEFPEYNQQASPEFRDRGRIKLLEDTNGDGVFDRATVYADQLTAPVAVACWNGGIYAGVVPDLWYFKDTDGDGRADIRQRVLTGFDRDKAGEGMLNSFRWGSDNRFHISTGLAGGRLQRVDRPDGKALAVRRQNILFDPLTGDFRLTSGGGQHGLTLDDWGDPFVCENSHPIQHLMYDSAYLARNLHVEAPSAIVDINAAGTTATLHRISPPEPWREVRTRLRREKLFDGPLEGGRVFGFFTGATGVTSYRGHAWPAEYRGDLFVGEVANNLIYRARPKPKGLGWTAERADSQREFLASRDIWFRPVQFANAPDGTLYVVDMYRELIETIESMPPSLLRHVDVAGGIDRGRIYRIVPDGFQQPKPPQLGQLKTKELIALLAHPNGWHRDTAARLLYQRQDQAAVGPLRDLAKNAPDALYRLHALSALHGLKALRSEDVVLALSDDESRLRIHALRWAEGIANDPSVRERVLAMVGDPDPRVRYQLAFSLGAFPGDAIVPALFHLVRTDSGNSWMRLAILTSANQCRAQLITKLLADAEMRSSVAAKSMIISLVRQAMSANRGEELTAIGAALDRLPETESAFVRDLIKSVHARPSAATIPGTQVQTIVSEMIREARMVVADNNAKTSQRVDSLKLLGRLPWSELRPIAEQCLHVRQPPAVQSAALEVLGWSKEDNVAGLIIAAWPGLSPPIRSTATEVLLSRPSWVNQLLDAVAAARIPSADIDPARIQVLEKSTDVTVRKRANELFRGTRLSKRADVLATYQKALELNGDLAKGKIAFKNNCSTCHRLDGVGTNVGPDLATMRNRGRDTILINILDPNREVLPQFYAYQLTTDAGLLISGMITTETATAVTIRRADGTSVTVPRMNIEQLTSTGISAMPEGLEKQIDITAMADLLAYIVQRP